MVARTGSRRLSGRDRGLIRVRGRQALSRGSSLAVVEVGTRVLVVGVSDGGVRLLTEMDPVELGTAAPVQSASPELSEPETGDDASPDEDPQAAYEHPAVQGALTGSLLSTSTWRQAWETATGRVPGSRPGDAA
jgi:flagellar protein FliO/FliZ